MALRLIMWVVVMACLGFYIAGRGSYTPLGLTITGALLGAAAGVVFATVFSRREKRKRESKGSVRRY
jgi:multisubunit Na+/H+ antiporter MnhB subunit